MAAVVGNVKWCDCNGFGANSRSMSVNPCEVGPRMMPTVQWGSPLKKLRPPPSHQWHRGSATRFPIGGFFCAVCLTGTGFQPAADNNPAPASRVAKFLRVSVGHGASSGIARSRGNGSEGNFVVSSLYQAGAGGQRGPLSDADFSFVLSSYR